MIREGCRDLQETRRTLCVLEMDDVMTGVERPVEADVADVGTPEGVRTELGKRMLEEGRYLAPVGLNTLHIGQGPGGESEG